VPGHEVLEGIDIVLRVRRNGTLIVTKQGGGRWYPFAVVVGITRGTTAADPNAAEPCRFSSTRRRIRDQTS
jgi:hypothetical protein